MNRKIYSKKLKKIIKEVEEWSGNTIDATEPEEIKVQIRQAKPR